MVSEPWRRSALLASLVAASTLALSGCAGITTGAYVNSGVGLAPYSTVGWGPPDAAPTGDPRLDNNPFFTNRVRADIEHELVVRGYTVVSSADPDLLVHIHLSMSQQIDSSLLDAQYCNDGDCRPEVYDVGTVVVDLVDPGSSTLVWRGWAKSDLGEVVNSQDMMERRIDESVTRIFAGFPPKR